MKTNPSAILRGFWLGLLLLCCSLPLRAEQFGLFTYEVVNGSTVTITHYPTDATGPVEIPAEIAGKPVSSIGHSAFYGRTGLTSVTIPSSVASIGYSAFSGCTGLTSVAIPFASIGSHAFSGCTGLTNVTFPHGLETLSYAMFKGCTGLTSFTIPSSVTSIGGYAFYGCTGLTSINVEAGNRAYASDGGVLLYATRTLLLLCPEGKAGSYSIPSSVISIGGGAFSGCAGLTSVTIPSSVTSIGGYAFYGCTGLTSATIPYSVTSIGFRPFESCSGLTSINVEAGNPAYASDGGVLLNAARTLLIRCPQGKAGSYSIPSGVTSIGPEAFYLCPGLTSVIIPSSVTSIGGEYEGPEEPFSVPAFTGCTAMTRMVFLGNAPITVSGEFAQAAPMFALYYLSSRSGFTSPTWRGYPATMIPETTYPAAGWLLEHGLWYDSDLHTDSDGDGVDLLMAYALDLDPRQNLRASLPGPVLSGKALSLNFHATAPGVTYRAETSTGLTDWTTTGVTQTAPGPDGRSTATVPFDAPSRFLRLSVED